MVQEPLNEADTGVEAGQQGQSSDERPRNLDALCARYGSAIVDQRGSQEEAKKTETTTRNALGVMREQGVFAFYLFLQGQWKAGGDKVWGQVEQLWQDPAVGRLLATQGEPRDNVIALTKNLSDLLLARKVAERMLVYALYGLQAERKKAKSKTGKEG